MKKIIKIVCGALLIAAGVIFALNAFEVTNINIFFDGWWTLFLIVPGVIGLFTERDKTGNIVCIAIGVLLLLWSQGVVNMGVLVKLIVPIIIAAIGLKLILGGARGEKDREKIKEIEAANEDKEKANGFALFAGQNINYDGQVFEGAELNAIFGGIDCQLKNAVFEKDCVITVSAIFGGVDIYLPDTVNVRVSSNSVFGGVSDKKHRNHSENAVTVYINATCMFGGVDIK